MVFRTPSQMQRGDLMLFRSGNVAHGAAQVIRDLEEGNTPPSKGKRVSFDARCRCVPHSSRLVMTERGEMCASAWSAGGRVLKGCQPLAQAELATSANSWCVIRRSAGGAGCVLQDGTLCPD